MERILNDSFRPATEYQDQAADEMCPQFSKLFTQSEDMYWGEQALLKVLLQREQQESAGIPKESDVNAPSEDDHRRRRAMILSLLGLKNDPESE